MKTIQQMARETGYPLVEYEGTPYIPPLLEMLIETARADEREACAKVADDYFGFNAIADAIRARSHT